MLLAIIAVCALLWSLESFVPLYRQRGRLRHALPNIGLTAIVLAINLALSFLAASASAHAIPNRLPVWMQLVLGIIALDLFTYAAHVSMHKWPLAWRFHRVHHSDEAVDVTTAFRQHPAESVWRILWQLPPILLLGIPMWMLAIYLALSAANAQLEHANIRLPERLDRFLRFLFVTPNMHKVHHSVSIHETDSNYANLFSLWDRLFGTYTARTDFETLRYGLDRLDGCGLRALLRMPFAQ